MVKNYDPDNFDCLLKDLLYFCNCSIEFVGGYFRIIKKESFIASFVSYFGCIEFLLRYASNHFNDLILGVDTHENNK